MNALYDAGRADDAVRLLTSTGQRSWLHMIAEGAGSPMEAWDPALKSNTTFSHPWAGSPAYVVYRGAMGIKPLAPGYKRFSVKPQPGGLTHAEATTPTVNGTIGSAFATDASGMDVAVKVPANSTAVVTLPSTGYLDHRATSATTEVGAGCHLLSTRGAGVPLDSVKTFAAAQGCDLTAPVIAAHDVNVPVGQPVPVPTATDAFDGDVPVSCDNGVPVVTCTATDAAGNTATASFTVTWVATAAGSVGGTVPATLALTVGSASFGAFQPGVDRTYTTTAAANVISTAGDAALSVDGGTLTNGAFSLREPLQVAFSKSSWTAPVSNDPVTITLSQHIGATDALRTGTYSKTLTFTLSTTTP